jgi:hypothetical protein
MKRSFGRIQSVVVSIVAIILLISAQTSLAGSLEDQEKALKIIADFAERLCRDIPLEGQGSNIDLSGKAKADLNGVISRIANLGIEGAAKYQTQDYKGLLQMDLARALKDSTDCRMQVWKDLKDKLVVPASKTSSGIDPTTARFGITLGWQMARYEFVYDSPLPEAKKASPAIRQEIERLLKQDGFPHPVEGLDYQQLVTSVLSYYGTSNLEKHASILLGIAAMRVTLVGASKNQQNNEQMRQLAYSAIQDIDSGVLPRKAEIFQELMSKKPGNVAAVVDLLNKMK